MADILKLSQRDVTGKKNRFLRRQGLTPVHVFGKGIESRSLMCDTLEVKRMIATKGTTRLLQVAVKGEKESRNVFIGEIQRNSISGELTHVDFYQINKAEKITMAVPIVLVGEAPVLKLKHNFIEHILTELELTCLPEDLPPRIEVDLSVLAEVNQAIHVRDFKLKPGIEFSAGLDQVVVKVSTVAAEKEETVPGAAAAETTAATAEPAA
jgi:large subunit ribosomal protein L25